MPPIPPLSLLARVRWGNVALAALIAGVAALLFAWPHVRNDAPVLPPTAPRPVAAAARVPAAPEFGVESSARAPRTTATVPLRAPAKPKRAKPKPKRAKPKPAPVHHHRPAHHHHTPAPSPPPVVASTPTPAPAPAPAPAPVAPPPPPPSGVRSEFGPPHHRGEFG
jgi:hypothetical protein